ncbi:hypothetical protein G7Z17_g2302 [Cylindrodendrum hubeiense]|uniref:Uncharacterized protein n=1 Tax=Cylindrodendrum hubeiense TaxID=595255 RepID=A0A9P5LBR0_9HYPO|nr:hypothetical protein G7Z17_g2302 [Cylindrodendrum hubeiense]
MDLTRLQDFIKSIDSAPPVSDAPANMYRLFRALYSVAVRYVQFRKSTPLTHRTKAGAQLNTCLNALGFTDMGLSSEQQETPGAFKGYEWAPGYAMGSEGMDICMEDQHGVNPIWTSNPAQLEEWFNDSDQVRKFIRQTNFASPQDEGSYGV